LTTLPIPYNSIEQSSQLCKKSPAMYSTFSSIKSSIAAAMALYYESDECSLILLSHLFEIHFNISLTSKLTVSEKSIFRQVPHEYNASNMSHVTSHLIPLHFIILKISDKEYGTTLKVTHCVTFYRVVLLTYVSVSACNIFLIDSLRCVPDRKHKRS